jgi:hypothetical protein
MCSNVKLVNCSLAQNMWELLEKSSNSLTSREHFAGSKGNILSHIMAAMHAF